MTTSGLKYAVHHQRIGARLHKFHDFTLPKVVKYCIGRASINRFPQLAFSAEIDVFGIAIVEVHTTGRRFHIAFVRNHAQRRQLSDGACQLRRYTLRPHIAGPPAIGVDGAVVQWVDIARRLLHATEVQVVAVAVGLVPGSVAVVILAAHQHIFVPAAAKAPKIRTGDAVFAGFMRQQTVGGVVKSTVRSHPYFVAIDFNGLNISMYFFQPNAVGRSDSLKGLSAIGRLTQAYAANPDFVGLGRGGLKVKIEEALMVAVAVSSHIPGVLVGAVVRTAYLPGGQRPALATVVAAVDADPAIVISLAVADERHIHAAGHGGGDRYLSAVIYGIGRTLRTVPAIGL